MELTVYAAWLNDVFALFDSFLLGLHHELALAYGELLTPIANAFGAAGHYGIMFLVLAVILLCFRQTRMAGVAIIVSIAIAGAFSEFIIKDLIDRPRPMLMSDTYNAWWQFVGSPDAHSSSFPSGHVAAATAAAISLAYAARRWWVSLLGILMVLVMAIDRMYLMVHYPSDVLGGFFLGFICGIIGYAIVQGIWRLMGKHPDQLADAKVSASYHARDIAVPRGAQPNYQYQVMPTAQLPAQQQARQAVQVPAQRGTQRQMQAPAQRAATQSLQDQRTVQMRVPSIHEINPAYAPVEVPATQPTQRMSSAPSSTQGRRPSNYAAAPTQRMEKAADKTQQMPQRIEDLRR